MPISSSPSEKCGRVAEARALPPRRLAGFTGAGYDKGASLVRQSLWVITQNLAFGTWWFPLRLRPALLRLFGAQIGRGVRIRHHVRVLWPWKLSIGEHSWVGEGVWLLNLEPIVLGANVCLSQEAFLCTGSHDRRSETFEFDNAPIVVEDGAWVATGVLVLRGVTVGADAVLGARAVVAHDVPARHQVAAGSVH